MKVLRLIKLQKRRSTAAGGARAALGKVAVEGQRGSVSQGGKSCGDRQRRGLNIIVDVFHTLSCTLTNGHDDKFMLCALYHKEKLEKSF